MIDISKERPVAGLEEFYHEFLADRNSELKEMNAFLERSEFDSIKKIAHKWKGFCAPSGFQYLETLSEALEVKASELSLKDVSEILLQIGKYLDLKEEASKGE